jgi:dipeptidyl aminopeptidase/acylaminoacyl peptidase
LGRHKAMTLSLTLVVIALVVGSIYLVARYMSRPAVGSDFLNAVPRRITQGGISDWFVTISPDGRFLAYRNKDSSDLVVRQLATDREITVVPKAIQLIGATFSPDGNYLYISYQPDQANAFYRNIYSVSSFGGPLVEIRKNADSRVCFLDGGKRIAYLRQAPDKGIETLLMADVDGSNERVVLTRGVEEIFTLDCNSKLGLIALAIRVLSQNVRMRVLVVNTEGKTVSDFPQQRGVLDLAWLPDGSGILYTARMLPDPHQVWLQPYPRGEPIRITNDLSQYSDLSVAGDGRSFVVTQTDAMSSVFTAPVNPVGGPYMFSSISASVFPVSIQQRSLSGLPTESLTYVSRQGQSRSLVRLPLNGKAATTVLQFDSEPLLIKAYDWSPDGKKLAVTRAPYHDTDVVMFSIPSK